MFLPCDNQKPFIIQYQTAKESAPIFKRKLKLLGMIYLNHPSIL